MPAGCNGHGDGSEHAMSEDLALELDHDRMLLRLCTSMGIETEPARFSNPLVERERLEACSAPWAWTFAPWTTTAGSRPL